MQRRIPMGQPAPQYGAKDYFIYSVVLADTLASGGTAAGSFNVDNDSDFLWQKGTFFANGGSGENEEPVVTVTIKDTTSGRDLMNNPIPITAMFGTGQLPFILPVPKLLPKTATITVNFANISASENYSYLALMFHGQKLFG